MGKPFAIDVILQMSQKIIVSSVFSAEHPVTPQMGSSLKGSRNERREMMPPQSTTLDVSMISGATVSDKTKAKRRNSGFVLENLVALMRISELATLMTVVMMLIEMKRKLYYYELAAMGGNVFARHNLGCLEGDDFGNKKRAVKHFMIAAGAGHDDSLEEIQQLFLYGHATKDEFEKALRAHKEAKDEMKSEQRESAAATYLRIFGR